MKKIHIAMTLLLVLSFLFGGTVQAQSEEATLETKLLKEEFWADSSIIQWVDNYPGGPIRITNHPRICHVDSNRRFLYRPEAGYRVDSIIEIASHNYCFVSPWKGGSGFEKIFAMDPLQVGQPAFIYFVVRDFAQTAENSCLLGAYVSGKLPVRMLDEKPVSMLGDRKKSGWEKFVAFFRKK